jgi:hypothetical protein
MPGIPNLSAIMRSAVPRERAGTRTQGRYNFQTNFGILKLVELHESGQDFRIIFDVFDDLMIVDSAISPAQAWFYQVKSKDPGDWTIPDICKSVGAQAPRSIISRLYAHIDCFGVAVAETALVSNAAYKLKLRDGSTTSGSNHRIGGTELHPDEITKVADAIITDINPADVPRWLPKLAFIRTTLGVHGPELVVIGRLQQHLELSANAGTVKTSALYQTLHASIVQRTTFSEEGIDHDQLLLRKSLTRQEVEGLLTRACARQRSFIEDWDIIRTDLERLGTGSIGQIKLKSAALAFIRDRNSGQGKAGKLSTFIQGEIKSNISVFENCESVMQAADHILGKIGESHGYSKIELKSAMIVEVCEAINAQS